MRIFCTYLLAAALLLIGGTVWADETADKVAAQKKAAEENWTQAEAGEIAQLETAHLLIYCSKSLEKKLKEIGATLEKHQEMARKALGYDEKNEPWPGKLTIYLFADREPFAAFVRRVEKRRVEAEDTGSHFVDSESPHAVAGPPRHKKDLALDDEIAEQSAAALLQKKAGKDVILPGWLLTGFGRATTYRIIPTNAAIRKERTVAAKLSAMKSAKDVWGETIDGDQAPVLAASVADYLAYGPESSNFSKFVASFKPENGQEKKTAAQAFEAAGLTPEKLDAKWRIWVIKPN
ncbi:MAG TPA: hypothetical protein VGG61_11235 [Gemmataceae bacterium]|jgi:hypothetical protein